MDATLEAVEKFDDPNAWDHIEHDVPIFREHEMWVLPKKDGTIDKTCPRIAVFPSRPAPPGYKKLYSIGEKELDQIAGNINRSWDDFGKPMKGFIGHVSTAASTPQIEQPPLVAYAVGAEVGRWGPKQLLGIIAKRIFYRKGCFVAAKEFPERSADYAPAFNTIPSFAFLKTEPRLPMGIQCYQADDLVCYGQGFDMADEIPNDTAPAAEAQPAAAPAAADPTIRANELQLSPEEQVAADKFVAYLFTIPEFKALREQFAAAQQAQQMAAAGPANGAIPAPVEGEGEEDEELAEDAEDADEGDEEDDMSDAKKKPADAEQYAQREADLAEREYQLNIRELEQYGIDFSDADDLRQMVRDRGAEGMEFAKKYGKRTETAPISDVPGSSVSLAGAIDPESYAGDMQFEDADVNEYVAYCEEHGVDQTNTREVAKAQAAVLAAKKAKGRRK